VKATGTVRDFRDTEIIDAISVMIRTRNLRKKMTIEEWNQVEKDLKKISKEPWGNNDVNTKVIAKALLLIMQKVRFQL